MSIDKNKTKQQRLLECIKLMEKISGKKVVLKEYNNYDVDLDNDIEISGDEDFFDQEKENKKEDPKALTTAIVEFIKNYDFDSLVNKFYDFDGSATEIKTSMRKQCLRDINENFEADLNKLPDNFKTLISKAMNARLMKIRIG